MTARVKLKPGQRGTKNLVAEYGDALLCVRYRYDTTTRTRLKTVELIIDRKPWTPSLPTYKDSTLVPVRIEYADLNLREQAKAANGKWNPEARAWYIQFGKIKGTDLEKFIILEAEADKKSI
jgi:hypothetical protein